MQLHSLVEALGEGIAILDSELCLSSWNPAYVAAARLQPDALQVGLPLDELLRRQAQAGAFGSLEDLEAEVARRVATVRNERDRTELVQIGRHDEPVTLHARGVPDGGLVLILGGAVPLQSRPAAIGETEPDAEDTAPAGSATIEW
jgi:PAS domain-containing protein